MIATAHRERLNKAIVTMMMSVAIARYLIVTKLANGTEEWFETIYKDTDCIPFIKPQYLKAHCYTWGTPVDVTFHPLPFKDDDFVGALCGLTCVTLNTVDRNIARFAEEYAMFGMVENNNYDRRYVAERVVALTSSGYLSEYVYGGTFEEEIDINADDFRFATIVEAIESLMRILPENDNALSLIADAVEETAICKKILGSKFSTYDHDMGTLDGLIEETPINIDEYLHFHGDKAVIATGKILEDIYDNAEFSQAGLFVNGIYYEGRFMPEPEQLSLIKDAYIHVDDIV